MVPRPATLAWLLAPALAVAACSLTPPGPVPTRTLGSVRAPVPSQTSPAAVLAPPTVPGLVWRPSGTTVSGQPVTYVATTGKGSVALMWMNPRLLSFRFIPGTQYPERGPVLPADRTPSTWVPRLAAAFNGAFKLHDKVGGYYYAGVTVSPLRPGYASLVIDTKGRLTVVKWGRERGSTAGTTVVRQNMRMLVDQYAAQTSVLDTPSTWGWPLHDAPLVNRSALGELADGSLVFAYGHHVTAATMAAALVMVHSRTGLMLDMNVTQPGGFIYEHVRGKVVGRRILRTVVHPANLYLASWIKDFVVALVRP